MPALRGNRARLFGALVLLCSFQPVVTAIDKSFPILDGIPTVPFASSGKQAFSLLRVEKIVVDRRFANFTDQNGSTLIPPTLLQFAETFSSDIQTVFNLSLAIDVSAQRADGQIFFTVDPKHNFVDAAGRRTSEGYSLVVNSSGIVVSGASPLGAWWASRTLLQQGVLHNASVPFGAATDAPGWATRGMMLDVGRHFYPKEFLLDMCAYMSFFKQNTFHLHLSDNLWNNPKYTTADFMHVYARFRLWSDEDAVRGLNNYANESYTRRDFDEIQIGCASRGVTVLPEIEAPGHALVITQWKPQLAYGRDMSLLNISHPDTIPAMKAVWETFLGWFHCRVVSIGADEYPGPQDDYYHFVNEMASFIGTTSGKQTRTWGMYPPGGRSSRRPIFQNISIQHWEFFEDDPKFDYIANNYSVVNSNDDFYVVNKFGGYSNTIDIQKTFTGSPTRGFWRPNIFDQRNATRNPLPSNKYVLGSIAALWNDPGPNATVYSEAYYAWRQGIPALADKQWGGSLTRTKFNAIFELLQPHIPGQNLERSIPSIGPVVVNYTFNASVPASPTLTKVIDKSPNSYDALTDCSFSKNGTTTAVNISPSCSFTTPLSSKGRDYTLSLSIRITDLEEPTNATIIYGRDAALMLTPSITLFSSGSYYRLKSNISFHDWVDVRIVGKGNQTFAVVASPSGSNTLREEFRAELGLHGDGLRSTEIAIEAPLHSLGGKECGWAGQIKEFSLLSVAF